jgi:hypothetical protein
VIPEVNLGTLRFPEEGNTGCRNVESFIFVGKINIVLTPTVIYKLIKILNCLASKVAI